jgi:hypothetical protein
MKILQTQMSRRRNTCAALNHWLAKHARRVEEQNCEPEKDRHGLQIGLNFQFLPVEPKLGRGGRCYFRSRAASVHGSLGVKRKQEHQ